MWLTLLGRYWYLVAIALLTGALAIQSHRLKSSQEETLVASTALETYKTQATMIATQAKKDSDNALEDARNDYALQKKAAEANAWTNAKARYANAACGVARTGGLPTLSPGVSGSETGVSSGTVPVPESEQLAVDRAFVDACAGDLIWVGAVKTWCHANELKGCE